MTALPPRFRLRLSDLVGGEVVRATETRPACAVSEAEQRLKNADSIDAIIPVYNDRLADAASDADITRLVFDEAVFKETAPAQLDATELIRVTDVSVAVTVTEDCLLLSLPTLDGTYDSQTEFIAETDKARHWGNHLLDYYWNSAQPPNTTLHIRIDFAKTSDEVREHVMKGRRPVYRATSYRSPPVSSCCIV